MDKLAKLDDKVKEIDKEKYNYKNESFSFVLAFTLALLLFMLTLGSIGDVFFKLHFCSHKKGLELTDAFS